MGSVHAVIWQVGTTGQVLLEVKFTTTQSELNKKATKGEFFSGAPTNFVIWKFDISKHFEFPGLAAELLVKVTLSSIAVLIGTVRVTLVDPINGKNIFHFSKV